MKIADTGTADRIKKVGEKEVKVDLKRTGKIIMDHLWGPGEHPDGGRPLSLYIQCSAKEVVESDALKFFPINALPKQEGPEGFHTRHLDEYFYQRFSKYFSKT